MNPFPRRSVRFFTVVAAATVLALVAGGCSTTLNDAATVGTTHITNRDFQSDLNALAGNADFAKMLSQNGFKLSAKTKTVDRKLSATWLTILVQSVVVDAEFNARHLKVSSQLLTAARTSVTSTYGGAKTVAKFPKKFVDAIVQRAARVGALQQSLQVQPKTPTQAQALAFYEQNKAQLFACASGKTVAHIVLPTQAAASAALAQVQGGATFATVAGQLSADAATKQTGGVIQNPQGPADCYPVGQDKAFETAVTAATPGTPTGPVQTAAGWQVILVTPYTPPTFAQVQSAVLQQLAQQAQQQAQTATSTALSKALEKRFKALKIKVDPQYGTWVLNSQGARVQPPTEPNPRSTRNPGSSTTTPQPQLGGSTGTTGG
ncbi:MAG: parvulin-like peptidyl-prolyl isomerase [Actinomycetia bacterium]|nr:parvulin-like peptidyl-prolyl isomerase [Actinomycetes bacterium]